MVDKIEELGFVKQSENKVFVKYQRASTLILINKMMKQVRFEHIMFGTAVDIDLDVIKAVNEEMDQLD